MPLPPPDTKEFTNRMSALAGQCRAELEETSQALQEIALLINQSNAEVDRLSQRELQLANRVREIDANLESYARSDIRDMLRAAHDIELRLLMMRSQLEQLQEREESIRSYQDKLRTLAELAESHIKTGEDQGADGSRTRVLRRGLATALATVPLADIIQAQEDERLRLARRVVDGPAQILANVILQAEICERLMDRDPEQARAELSELRAAATKALVDARRMLYELRPVTLGELGVVQTLRRYVTEIARQRQIEANVIGPESDDKLPEVLRVALYRLCQEAISAVAADDNVTHLDLDIRYEDAQVIGSLEARGEGIQRSQSISRFREDDLIRQRLDQLGAELHFEPVGESTVRLTLVVPLA